MAGIIMTWKGIVTGATTGMENIIYFTKRCLITRILKAPVINGLMSLKIKPAAFVYFKNDFFNFAVL